MLGSERKGLCLRRGYGGKTSLRLVAVECNDGFALVDTRLQEDSLHNALASGLLPWCRDCVVKSRWPRLGNSRLDFLVDAMGRDLYIEAKSAVQPGPNSVAMYPDTYSERGRKHLKLLIEYSGRGVSTAVVFIAGIPGARAFKPNTRVDPQILYLLREAVTRGVIVKAVGMMVDYSQKAVVMYNADLPVILD